MEYEVKVNPEGIKKLRESRSWTQEHLASAAGVSSDFGARPAWLDRQFV